MEILFAMLIASLVVKHTAVNGALDVMFARRGQTAPHHERAMKRMELYRQLTSPRGSGRGSGGSGRGSGGTARGSGGTGGGSGTGSGGSARAARDYFRTLWADSWTDARTAHDRRRIRRQNRPAVPGAARSYFAGVRADLIGEWDKAWVRADTRRRERRAGTGTGSGTTDGSTGTGSGTTDGTGSGTAPGTADGSGSGSAGTAPGTTAGTAGTGSGTGTGTTDGTTGGTTRGSDDGSGSGSADGSAGTTDGSAGTTPGTTEAPKPLPWHVVTGAAPGSRGLILGRYATEEAAKADLDKYRERAADDPDAHYWINGPRPSTDVPPTTVAGDPPNRKAEPAMTEITGLKSALLWSRGMAEQCQSGTAGIEGAQAALAQGEVTGEAVEALAAGAEHLQAAAAAFAKVEEALTPHLGVAEQYAANPDAGSREFVTAE